jgi:lipid-A-disaccharide synthase
MHPIFVVAGEPSGDVLGAALIKGLKHHTPSISFCGVGGPLMEEAGSFHSLFPIGDLAHMGIASVLRNGPKVITRFYQTFYAIKKSKPLGLLTIDAPGFCLSIGKRINTIARVHCVSPSVWAWKPHRARTLVPFATDHLLSLFPFEAPYYTHMPYSFIGHPVCSLPKGSVDVFWSKYGPKRPLLCLLPGSRAKEIKTFLPVLLETAQRLRAHIPNLLVASIKAPSSEHLWPNIPKEVCLMIPHEEKHHVFAASTLAIAASGTVTLELAHQGTPMIIGYQVPKITEWIMKRMLTTPCVGLINILATEPFVPEYLQERFTPQALEQACIPFFNDANLGHKQSARSLASISCLWAGAPFGELGAAAIMRTFVRQ